MAQWRQVIQVDAFTTTPCTGNAAAVIPEAADLDPVQMQRIAREMNVSETAFVLPSAVADFRLRWWTPSAEVPLCGHATIAACHALVELGLLAAPGSYRIETAVGVLGVELELIDGAPCRVWLEIPIPDFNPARMLPLAIASALRADEAMLVPEMPPLQGGDYLYLAFHKVTDLLALRPDWSALELLSRTHGVAGFACYALEAISPAHAVHMRFFAPAFGVNEDPVTGSAQGPLGALLVGLGLIQAAEGQQVVQYRAEQGDAQGRPGRVEVQVDLDERHEPQRVRIGGVAVTVLRGEIQI